MELDHGISGKGLAEKMNQRKADQALVIGINGKMYDLDTPLQEGDKVQLIGFDTPEGKEVFWHTSSHVLAQAVLRLWPEAVPTIGPAIEQGFYYDFANLNISEEDFGTIEKEIKDILREGLKPERVVFNGKKGAIDTFGNNPFKKELIEGFEEGDPISAYRQGEFFDLCRGPHLPTIGKIKAFKILKTSGAYWKGNAKNQMLTRIYGISFPSRLELQSYLQLLEETKKRDHRLLGARLNLFSFHEAAPGIPFFHPQGMIIWDHLIDYWKKIHLRAGYAMIKTPQLMTQKLWKHSGHWDHYRENMFTVEDDHHSVLAIKPMNCPGSILYFKQKTHSYRELPLRLAEVGHVHRKEPSGALNGLFRVQGFHQDDAHLFIQPSQIKDEILKILTFVKQIYYTFGLKYTFELSTRPEKSIGTDRDWEIGTNGLKNALDEWKEEYTINRGDGAFYGPKIDFHVHDALGRSWQCGTVQLDMALPEKFELGYKDSDGKLKRPMLIHRAVFGSIERFLGILIEHFAGKFPLWMSPCPIRIIPVADHHISYAHKVIEQIEEIGFTCDCDHSHDSLAKKIRKAQLDQVNYILTVGDKEHKNQTITLRTRDSVVHGEVIIDNFLETCKIERKERQLTSPYQKESR